jgi:hypothetical protein
MLRYETELTVKPLNLLQSAQALVQSNRARGLAALNDLFRAGTVPDPRPNGRYAGKLIALDIAPGLTQVFQWLTNQWLPWNGKTFDVTQQRGDNIFTRDSYPLARLCNPLYRGFTSDTPKTYRGFAFRTYTAPGLFDTDRTVLKIDYNLKENPALTVRRVLDELVQLDNDLYLGKAHVRWWWSPDDSWQTVAYFSLVPVQP